MEFSGRTGGDCACEPGEVESCAGPCVPEEWVGDDVCDASLDCAIHNRDGNDCVGEGSPCSGTQIVNCEGNCASRSGYDSGHCSSQFNCEELNWSNGNCAH